MTLTHRTLAVLGVALYLALAWGLDSVFPCFRFDMFSHPWEPAAGTPVARLPDGRVVSPFALEGYRCVAAYDPRPPDAGEACRDVHVDSGYDRWVASYLADEMAAAGPVGVDPRLAPGPGEVAVAVERRVHRFTDPEGAGAIAVSHCPLLRCVVRADSLPPAGERGRTAPRPDRPR